MIELTIDKENINRIHKLLDDLSPQKQGGAIDKAMLKASGTVLRQLVYNVSGGILKRRTGDLARSMGFRLERPEGYLESIIGSGASLKLERMVYANIHETGGIIRPKKARKLAIPIGDALTPSGVARFTPKELRDGLTGYNGSFIGKSGSGSLMIFGKRKRKVMPLFILKDRVKIPARRYMSITVEQIKDQVVEDVVDKIKEAKEKA